MSNVKVLFFAADPLSAPPDGHVSRLLLDEDVRQIREKVRAAEHRDALEFDVRWAARTDDLLQALNETRPRVVHFSGHGGSEGLVLVGADGHGAHHVDAAALEQLFRVFRGDIQVVVLNACFSLPQARAIAGAVGCAIGTRGKISDRAAITFGASFYRAVAFGRSVQAAYDQASAALALEHFEDRECPQLVARPDVDPARLVLVPPGGRRSTGRVGMAAAGLALAAAAAAAASWTLADRDSGSAGPPAADSTTAAAPPAATDTVPATDTTPPAAPARERAVARSGGERRQPAAVTQPADGGEKPAETVREPESATVVRKLEPPRDTFAVRERPRDPTLQPTGPR